MEITDVRIRKISTDGKMKAIVSVTFDNEFVVHDIAHPINTTTREKIQTSILNAYEVALKEETVENSEE